MKVVLAIVFGIILGSGFSAPLENLQQIAAFYLKHENTSQTFEVTGKLTFIRVMGSNSYTTLVIENPTGSAMFFANGSNLIQRCHSLRLGDIIKVKGKIAKYVGVNPPLVPIINDLTFIRHGPAREPLNVPMSELWEGKWHFHIVNVRGILRDAVQSESNPSWTLLVLRHGPYTFYASMPRDESDLARIEQLIGQEITVECFSAPFGGGRLNRNRLNLCIRYSKDLKPVHHEPSQAYPDISTLVNVNANALSALGNHSATGRILACYSPSKALMETSDGKMVNLKFVSGPLPANGQWITAVGLPEPDFFSISMDHVRWKSASSQAMPELTVLTPALSDIIKRDDDNVCIVNNFHGNLLRFSGIVRSVGDRQLFMETDGELVCVDAGLLKHPFEAIAVGCKVEVTGICLMEYEPRFTSTEFPQLRGFKLIMRQVDDLRVLTWPPWWTPERLMAAIGTLVLVLLAIVIWNVTLRQLVNRRSRELFREQLRHVKAELRTEERTRLAIELHDTIAQNLTGVSMEIETARELRGNAPANMTEHLDLAAKALKSCREELRNCLWDLRCEALEATDMNTAIRLTLQPHLNDSCLRLRFNVPRNLLSDTTVHQLLMVIRELSINAVRHGHATEIRVAGSLDQDKLFCSVSDNGCGFDPEHAPGLLQGHFGLRGVRERIEKLNGEFSLHSAIGKGTKVKIQL